MSSEAARAAARSRRSAILTALVALGVVVSAAALGVRHDQSLVALVPGPPSSAVPPSRLADAAGEADGVVPDGVTVFDDGYPAVARLVPALRAALRRATSAARKDGGKIVVTSGWRSPKYQEQLLRAAISKYGSRTTAARWVATAETSPHVAGAAVDLGPTQATVWLSRHGSGYGLCQIYRNEPWHYELRPQARGRGCPPMYADPTHDPRMQ